MINYNIKRNSINKSQGAEVLIFSLLCKKDQVQMITHLHPSVQYTRDIPQLKPHDVISLPQEPKQEKYSFMPCRDFMFKIERHPAQLRKLFVSNESLLSHKQQCDGGQNKHDILFAVLSIYHYEC